MAQLVKNPPAMQENPVRFLGWEDPLEKGTATYSSILAWRIPRTVYSPRDHKESDMTERLSLHFIHVHCSVRICRSLLIQSPFDKCLSFKYLAITNIAGTNKHA